MLRHLLTRFLGDVSGEMLRSTARVAAIVSVFSIGSAYYLSERLEGEKRALDQLAANATQDRSRAAAQRQGVDMSATGSIARNAQNTRIDPCAIR